MEFHRSTEQILLGNQVQLYQVILGVNFGYLFCTRDWVESTQSGTRETAFQSVRGQGWSWHTLAESKSAQPTRAVW